jgi:hypothetical protein
MDIGAFGKDDMALDQVVEALELLEIWILFLILSPYDSLYYHDLSLINK